MIFRFRLFSLHLAVSFAVLTVVIGALYLGWYYWPGWYLAMVTRVVVVMAGVDLALGPLLTFVVANPAKERRTLARDIAVIATVQLLALGYASVQLWSGRPLYYVYSSGILQVVQAYDIEPAEVRLAQEANPGFAPHWYSLPRWTWAPEPADAPTVPAGTIRPDYSTIPRLFKPWEGGCGDLRTRLLPIDALGFFIFNERATLKERMRQAGLNPDLHNAIPMTGRGRPVLVVFDPPTMQILAILKPG